MTNKVQHHSWVPRIRLQPVTTASAVGALLLSAVPAAWSQGEKTPKPPAYNVLYTFTGGGMGLRRDREGNLYGTTAAGGESNCSVGYFLGGCGVVFKLDRTAKESVLHTFTGPPDGADPVAGRVRDEEGNLYGTTAFGGTYGFGAVFKVGRNGSETVLYSFTGGADGNSPQGSLIRDEKGNLYGTTTAGGDVSGGNGPCPNGCGVELCSTASLVQTGSLRKQV